ncbi:hypothetical protein B0H12DRAFT_1078233 [Mycena haematopus]|nr:hypothetical protein B0H12DRAFT_1078233 [Mycena haematopus]
MLWPSATQIDGIDVPGPADQLASKATVPDRYHVHLFSGLLVAETPSVDIAMKWLKSGLAAGVNFTDFIKSKEKYAMAPGGEYDTDMSMIWNFRIHIIFWPALGWVNPLTGTRPRPFDGFDGFLKVIAYRGTSGVIMLLAAAHSALENLKKQKGDNLLQVANLPSQECVHLYLLPNPSKRPLRAGRTGPARPETLGPPSTDGSTRPVDKNGRLFDGRPRLTDGLKPYVRRTILPLEETVQAIVDEVEPDVTQSNGPRYVKSKLKDKLILVPRHVLVLSYSETELTVFRDVVREVMLEHFGDGFNARYPGRKKTTVVRQSLSALGPFHEVSADGHEKLSAQALKMGDIGFPIYAWKDKWTAYLLKILLRSNSIPTKDLKLAGSTLSRQQFGVSHNIIIEAFWRWLKEKWGVNMREHILRGKNEHIYVPEVAFHRDLVNWIFPPLIQSQLNEFRTHWNQHTIRTQSEKDMPSGHAPADALKQSPALFGGIDCGIRVPKEAIQEFRDALTEEVGPRDSFLAWVSPEFDQLAKEVFESLDVSEITIENAWDVFRDMSSKMETLI